MDERSGIIPSAKKMRERCAKHFTAGVRDGLFGDVWLHVAAAFAAKYAHYEALTIDCFETTLTPTAAMVRQVFFGNHVAM